MKKGETVIATIRPLAPPFLDERARAELGATIQAARSAILLAEVERQRVQTALELARSDFSRAERLAATRTVSERALEKAANDVALLEAQGRSAEATIRMRKAELASDLARLVEPGQVAVDPEKQACCLRLRSPVDGTILKMRLKSAQAVSAGAVVADVGDPARLEIVVDLLSSDAVRVHPGSKAIVTEWGGDHDLPATVRRIEPAGFTKVSALGIEEQRVNVVLDLDRPEPRLGDAFRVFARIVSWHGDDVLQVPLGALFRTGDDWTVFRIESGRARLVAHPCRAHERRHGGGDRRAAAPGTSSCSIRATPSPEAMFGEGARRARAALSAAEASGRARSHRLDCSFRVLRSWWTSAGESGFDEGPRRRLQRGLPGLSVSAYRCPRHGGHSRRRPRSRCRRGKRKTAWRCRTPCPRPRVGPWMPFSTTRAGIFAAEEEVRIAGERRKLVFLAAPVGLVAGDAGIVEDALAVGRGGLRLGRLLFRRRVRAQIGPEIVQDLRSLRVRQTQPEAIHVVEDGAPCALAYAGGVDHRLEIVAGLAMAVDEITSGPFGQVEARGGPGAGMEQQKEAGGPG